MIKNEQQLATSRAQQERLKAALDSLQGSGGEDPLTRARKAALEADLAALDAQIAQYRSASAGAFDFDAIEQVGDVGDKLVLARIAAGLTQADLAREVGSKEQQIQRYERSRYATASLGTLTRIATVLLRMRERRRGTERASVG
jgi:ribosome-binding protein aMBF1 (putative translation factor)